MMKMLTRSRLSLGFRCFSSSCSYDVTNFTKQYNHLINNKESAMLVNHRNGLFQMLTCNIFHKPLTPPVSVKLPKDYLVCGPCNGLFCLYSVDGEVLLWNPGTGDMKNLPSEVALDHEIKIHNVGFGFDSKASDYKILRYITREFRNPRNKWVCERIHQVEICSLKSKQWREIPVTEEIASNLPFLSPGSVFADGACHWTCNIEMDDYSIDGISFDFAEEEFEILCIPCWGITIPCKYKIYNYRGCLAIFQYYRCKYNTQVQVWVKKPAAAGVETWVHEMEMGPFECPPTAPSPLVPLCVWKNDGLFLADAGNKMYYYEFMTKEARQLMLAEIRRDRRGLFDNDDEDDDEDDYDDGVLYEDIINLNIGLGPGRVTKTPAITWPSPQALMVPESMVPNPW